jgi:shikimate kinase
MTQRLVLIGFRGAGKSTLAAELASRLTMEMISTDVEIERRTGTRIADFVVQNGWEEFRRIEGEVIAALPRERVIIDCGGGVIEHPDNMRRLRENALIVWVDADVEDIITRLTGDNNAHRPLLSASSGVSMAEDTRSNYARRKPLYEQWCGVYVNTSQNSLEEASKHIIETFTTLSH